MLRERPRFCAVTMVMLWSVAATIPAQAEARGPESAPKTGAKVAPEAAPETAPTEASPSPEVPPPAETTPPPASTDAPVVAPTEPAASPEASPIGADMLDAEAPPASTPTRAPTVVSKPSPAPAPDDELSPSEAITRAYAPKFRPNANPGRLNIAGRLMFANAGAKDASGGRFGGLAVDVGQSWNRFGYALTATAYGGRFSLAETGNSELNALIGVGPTVGLGRMALLGRGFLDLRVGYDFYYGVVNQRDTSTVVRPQSSDVAISPTKNLAPHGPRVRLDLGLIALDDSRRYWHGIGVSMGYQALVGSFRGEMPLTHMLTLGLSYWMG